MTYTCEDCGKEYKTRSGLWKHQKSHGHGKFRVDKSETIPISESSGGTSSPITTGKPPSSDPTIQHEDPPGDTPFTWADFDFGSEDQPTDVIPTPLKSIVKPMPGEGGKLTKAQRQALENQNKGILKMGLTTIDVLLTKYGQAVSLDEDFKVEHSESDKDLVANAQYRYLEEKGLFLTNYLSTGMIAGSLTVWYVGSPLMRIRKNAKKKLIRGRLLSRLPLIGRFFRRKEEPAAIAQEVEE